MSRPERCLILFIAVFLICYSLWATYHVGYMHGTMDTVREANAAMGQ